MTVIVTFLSVVVPGRATDSVCLRVFHFLPILSTYL
jgi:hypothetical protein